MKLSDLAKQIMKEDTWGNNPSAAGAMSPGRSPTATPPATPNAKMLDISNTFKNFKLELEKQEDASAKKMADELKKSFLKKNVSVKASKGSIGQIEKEYQIFVSDVSVRYMKDKYYIVFTGKEEDESEKEYYLNDSIIQVDNSATPVSSTGTTGGLEQSTGNTKRNIVPQK